MASPLDNFLNRQTSVLTGGESNDLIDALLRSSRITPYKPTALAQADRVRKMNEAANAADGGFLKKAFGALGKTAMYGLNTLGETSRAIGLGVGNLVAPALESGFGLEKGSLRFDIDGDGDNTNDNILTGLRDALSPNSRVIGFGETDLLRVQDDDSGAMRWAKYLPALGLDVATDPLTYVTAGAGTLGRTAAAKAAGDAMFAIGRKAGAEGAEAAATKIAKEALEEAGDEVIKKQATSMLARNRDKVFRYATKEGLDADTAVDQLVSKLGKDDLVELAAEELGIKAQGAYRRGQTRALRRELGNALESEELGTKLFRQLPDNIQGGIRFGGNKITGRNSGGGQLLERFGAKGDKVGDLIERGIAARNNLAGRALPSFGETGFLVKQAKVGAAAARKDASKVAAQETAEGAIRGVAKGKAVAAATGQRLAQKAAEGALAQGQGFKEFGQEYLDEATIAFNQRNMKQYAEEVLAEGSTASPAKKRATQDVMRMVAQQEQEFATNLGRFGDEFSQVEALTDTQRRVLTEEAQRRLRQMGGDGRAEGRLRNFVERTGKFQDPETGEWLSPQEANAMWRAEGNDFDLFETDPFKVHMQTLGRMKRAAEGAARFDGLASVGAEVRDIEDAPLSFETLVKDAERSLLDPTTRAADRVREQARRAANPGMTDLESEALTVARRLEATEENEALLRDEIQKILDERNAVTAEKTGVKKREEEAALRAKRSEAKSSVSAIDAEEKAAIAEVRKKAAADRAAKKAELDPLEGFGLTDQPAKTRLGISNTTRFPAAGTTDEVLEFLASNPPSPRQLFDGSFEYTDPLIGSGVPLPAEARRVYEGFLRSGMQPQDAMDVLLADPDYAALIRSQIDDELAEVARISAVANTDDVVAALTRLYRNEAEATTLLGTVGGKANVDRQVKTATGLTNEQSLVLERERVYYGTRDPGFVGRRKRQKWYKLGIQDGVEYDRYILELEQPHFKRIARSLDEAQIKQIFYADRQLARQQEAMLRMAGLDADADALAERMARSYEVAFGTADDDAAEAAIADIAADAATRRSEALMQIDAIEEQLAEAAARRAETMKSLTAKERSLTEKAERRTSKLDELTKASKRAAQAQVRIDKRTAKGAVKAEEILSGAKDIFEQEEMLGKLMREAAIMDPDTRTRVMAQLIENLKKAKQADVQRADAKVKNLEQLAKEEAGNPEIGDLVDQLHAAERRKLAAERNLRRFEVGVDPSKSEFNKAVASGTWMRAGTRVKNGKTITDDVVGAFRGSWVNATIADGINQMIRLEDSRFAETAWMSAYTEFEKLWRTYATVGRGPSFITRNILGGIYNASIAGTTPADLVLGRRYASAVVSARKEAVQRLESGALPALEEESFLDSVLRERLSQEPWRDGLSLWDMHQEMQLRGHFNTQSSLATDRDMMSIAEYVKGAKREVLPNIDRETAGAIKRGAIKAADFGANNRWVRTMGTWSQNSELFLRAAVFEAGARKYGSDRGGLAMADALVKASQFDYSDLAPWERKMVGFVAPFWVWTRNNVPLQFRSFAARPGVPNAVLTGNEYASEYFGDPNAEDANDFAPKFVRSALGFAGLRPGDDSKSPVYYGIGAPLSDITKFIPEDGELRGKSLMAAPFAALQSLGEDGVAQLNPFIKTAVEGITDVNLFTGAKFNDKQKIADIERYIPFIDARTNAEGELIGSGQARQTFRNLLPGIAQAQRISSIIPGINEVTATQADRDRMLTTAAGPLLGLSGLPFLAPMATATESSVNAEIMRQDDLLRAELTKMAERNGVDPEIVLELIGKVPAERIAELIQTGSL